MRKLKLVVVCNECKKLYTHNCPIRVWGRTEKNFGKHLDIILGKDFCSRGERE